MNEFEARVRAQLGREADDFLEALKQPPARAMRLNQAREDAAEAARALFGEAVPWCECGRYIAEGAKPGSDILHAAGCYYMQEASAMAPAEALNPARGELTLDLCAAPGGKASRLYEKCGLLVANEPERSRARVLAANFERLGIVRSAVTNEYPDVLAARWPETFDAVLVDAPCSGEGMFRREPEAIKQWNPSAPEGCAKRQAAILDSAAILTAPGGRICYSTCTFNEIENEMTIAAFLKRHADFEPVSFSLPGVGEAKDGIMRLWPHKLRGDGHFLALMRKAGSSGRTRGCACEPCENPLPEALARMPESSRGCHLREEGDYICLTPDGLPDTSGLRLISIGAQAARRGKGYLEPAHALAMALKQDDSRTYVELEAEDAAAYLSGEALEMPGRGWALVTYKKMPLGWGKLAGGMLKNHLPKGLRGRFTF